MFSDEEKDRARKAAEAAFVGVATWEEAVRADCVAAGADVRLHHVADALLDFTANLLATRGGTMTADEVRMRLARISAHNADDASAIRGHFNEIGARIAVLEAEVARLTQHEAEIGSRFDALASKHSVAQQQIADLEKALSDADAEIHAVRARSRDEKTLLRVANASTFQDTIDWVVFGHARALGATEEEARIAAGVIVPMEEHRKALVHISDLEKSLENARQERDSAQREAQGWRAMENERRQERDAALQQVEALGRNFEEACQKAEALRKQWEDEREANRELVRRAQQAEVEAEKSEAECAHVEADLKDAKATLEMYRNAWKRELGAFLRWKAHEIDALVVSTKHVVDMARDSETWRTKAAEYDTERNEAWAAYRKQDARANEAEDEVDRVSTERDALKARVAELEERCARLSVAGQALSDHADKTAGGPLTEDSP